MVIKIQNLAVNSQEDVRSQLAEGIAVLTQNINNAGNRDECILEARRGVKTVRDKLDGVKGYYAFGKDNQKAVLALLETAENVDIPLY